jgi:hypothetical protein
MFSGQKDMRTDSSARRSRATSVFGGVLALAAATAPLPAGAGDRLEISQLVERSQGAVVLDVRPGRGKADALRILQVVAGPVQVTMPVPPEWNADCIPSRAELKRWLAKYKSGAERALWQKAVRAPRFEAVVFYKPYKGQLLPFCELESMLLEHTSLHPDFASYLAKVKAEWAKRQAVPAP